MKNNKKRKKNQRNVKVLSALLTFCIGFESFAGGLYVQAAENGYMVSDTTQISEQQEKDSDTKESYSTENQETPQENETENTSRKDAVFSQEEVTEEKGKEDTTNSQEENEEKKAATEKETQGKKENNIEESEVGEETPQDSAQIPTDTPTVLPTDTPDVTVTNIPSITATPTPAAVVATVTFEANGGKFPKEGGTDKVVLRFTAAQLKQLEKRRLYLSSFPIPQRQGYVFDSWSKKGSKRSIKEYIKVRNNSHETYVVNWDPIYYEIDYHLKGGALADEDNAPYDYHTDGGNVTLPKAYKKGYVFKGWYTNAACTGKKITVITSQYARDLDLYAKWVSAKPDTVEIDSATGDSQALTIQLTKVKRAVNYQVYISTNKNFTKGNVIKYELKTRRKLTIPELGKGTYYIKARAGAYDDLKNICYGTYGKVAKVTIKGKKKEYEATDNSAVVTRAKVISQKKVSIQAKVDKQVKSSDSFYYLVKVNATHNTGACMMSKALKAKTIKFELDPQDKANVISKFAIAVKKNGKYRLISPSFYLDNIEKLAKNTTAYYVPSTKKGIHYADNDYNLGAKWTLCNLNLNHVMGSKGNGTPYVYNGKTYYFNSIQEERVKSYNQKKLNVTMVLFMTWEEKNKFLIAPSGREAGHNYYALNTVDEESRETLEAMFSFLGETFSQKGCLVSNWILGNEVNSQRNWNYAGNISLHEYAKSYAQAFTMLNNAVHSSYKNAKVYIPLDGAWALPNSQVGWNGKTMLASFDSALETEKADVKWNLAFHAYSVPLTGPSYKRNSNLKKNENTSFIGMCNIEVLTDYISRHYGTDTSIILSEQGYTVYMGENKQAASLAYGYYKAEFNPMIDAFIIVRVFDNKEEVAQGLAMGLKEMNGRKRKAYNVFKYMDTPQCEKYTKGCLKTMKKKSWKKAVPGYNLQRFQRK